MKLDDFKVYDYVLVYVDNLLVVSHDLDAIMELIAKRYRLKTDPSTGKA